MTKKILGKKLIDIYLVGFVDIENGVAEFYPDYRWIYFEFENLIIEFEATIENGHLKILEVDELRYMFDMDEDMYKAKSSIAETILVSSFLQNNIVEKVEFGNMIEKDGFIQCDFAEIHLKNNQVIFLDPTFHYGIGIGGKEQKEYWTYCNQKSLK